MFTRNQGFHHRLFVNKGKNRVPESIDGIINEREIREDGLDLDEKDVVEKGG